MKMSRETLRVELYGGEDYRIYDGTRLVATVYAQADLKWLLDRDTALRADMVQAQAENARLREALQETMTGFERCMRSVKIDQEFIDLKLKKAQAALDMREGT